MKVSDFEEDSKQKLAKMLIFLQNQFGLKLNLCDAKALLETFHYCEEFKLNYKRNNHLSGSEKSADYTKAFLLSEAIRMILREIAPKRKIKKKFRRIK